MNREQIDRAIDIFEANGRAGSDIPSAMQTALAALRNERERLAGCEICRRGKPIKAFTYLPNGLQYGTSIEAKYCPVCGKRLERSDQ